MAEQAHDRGTPVDAAAGIAGWRTRFLQVALAATAGSMVTGAATYALLTAQPRATPVLETIAVGALLAGLWRWRSGPQRVRALLFLVSLVLVQITSLSLGVWSITFVAPGVVALVAACLLFGRQGLGILLLLNGALLWTGGWLVSAGALQPDLAPLRPERFAHWARVAALFVFAGGGLAVVLLDLVGLLVRTSAQDEEALAALRVEQARAEGARAQRRRAEAALHEARSLETLGALGQGLAHRFNNLLTVARAALDDLREASSQAQALEARRRLLAAATAAARPAADLLLFGRRTAPAAQALAIGPGVAAALPAVRQGLRDGVRLEVSADEPAGVHLDQGLLQRLLFDLVRNGAEAIPGEGTVTVAARRVGEGGAAGAIDALPPGDYVALSVSDTGPGMNEETLRRACEPFFTSKGRDQHDGLGLSICLGIARRAGGSLEVRSVAGQGTAVIAYLPVAAAAPEGPQAPELPAAGPPATPGASPPAEAAQQRSQAPSPTPAAGTPALAAPAGSPSGARPPPPVWRQRALEQVLRTTLVAYGACAALLLAFIPGQRLNNLLLIVPAYGLLAWAALRRSRRYLPRLAGLLVAAGGTCAFYLLRGSFLAPGTLSLLFLVLVWSAIFGGWRAAGTTVAASAGWLLVCGAIYPRTGLALPFENISPLVPLNWLRVGLIVPVCFYPIALSVLSVVEAAEEHLRGLGRSLANLEAARAAREREHAAALEAERRLQKGARLETAARIAGGVAKELDEALRVLLDFSAGFARAPQPEGPPPPERMAELEWALEHAEALVTQLGGESTSRATPLDVVAAVRGALGALERSLPPSVSLALDVEGPAFARVHRGSLRRVLLSLASNAADAMPSGGRLTLRVRASPKEVSVEVADTGTGMTAEVLGHAFEPFFTTKAPGQAVGLGLHAARRLVEANQGTIELQSAPGAGTRVALRWPACVPPRPRQPAPAPAAGGLVLLAEDEDAVRRLMVRALQKVGFEVVAVADGDQALAAIRSARPWRALCTDAVMPGCPTAQLVDEFTRLYPDRPVLLCSGYPPELVAEQTWRPQVSFLAKPFSTAQLSDTLLDAVAGRSRPN